MTSNQQHPITSPQGAAALAVVLAVASAFGPMLFNLQAAMVFAAMSVGMIIWIYWREGTAALASKRWDRVLTIPIVAIALIGLFSALSFRSARDAPQPIPIPRVDDIANRVTLLILPRLQQMLSQKDVPTIGNVRIRTNASTPPSRNTQVRQHGPANPPPMEESKSDVSPVLARLAEQVRRNNENLKAYRECLDTEVDITTRLFSFVVKATKDLNAYSASADSDKIAADYQSWLLEVNQFLAEKAAVLPSRSAFDAATDPDPRPTFLFIHNSGYHTWALYNAKRVALNDLDREYARTAHCPVEASSVGDRNNSAP